MFIINTFSWLKFGIASKMQSKLHNMDKIVNKVVTSCSPGLWHCVMM